MFKKLLKNNNGNVAIEYALIAALIAVVAIPAIDYVGQEIKCSLEHTAATLSVGNGGPSVPGRCGVTAGNNGGGHGNDDNQGSHGNGQGNGNGNGSGEQGNNGHGHN